MGRNTRGIWTKRPALAGILNLKPVAAGILAVTVGRSWTDCFRTFVELAGRQLASSRHGGAVVSFDVGTAYLLSSSVQVDAVVSRGITHISPDWEFGAGLSIKF